MPTYFRASRMMLFCAVCVCGLFIYKKTAEEGSLRALKYTSREKALAILWQEELRTKLGRLLKMEDLLSRSAENSLNPKTLSSEDKGKYVLHEMEINSTPTRRIKIVLTLPADRKGPFPAVLCIAGHGGSRHTCYQQAKGYFSFAKTLAGTGYVTISTAVSQHKVYEEGRTLMGERLWDLMRCVDFLTSLKEVDSRRIGCAGKSLGGEMAMWLGAMDERVQATVSSGFLTRMDQMEKGHCMCWKFLGLRVLVDFSDIYSLIAPRALLCQNGLKEPSSQFPVAIAREALKEIRVIYQDFEQPKNLAFVAHKGGHVFDVPSLLTFLDEHLGGRKNGAQPPAPADADKPRR